MLFTNTPKRSKMVKMTKKAWIITGVLAGISIFAALAYVQVQKALKYAFKFSRIDNLKVSTSNISMDVFVKITNPSKITYKILEIQSKIFINDVEITQITSDQSQEIVPGSESEISVRIDLSPKDLAAKLKGNYLNLMMSEKLNMKVETNIKVGYQGIFSIHVPIEEIYDLGKMIRKKIGKR